jgi:hypothetical protein
MPFFTTDSILLYLHNELPINQISDFEQCLEKDWAMQEKLQILASIENSLIMHPLEKPSSRTIQSILSIAKQKVEKVKL